jgi:hypothetical protein
MEFHLLRILTMYMKLGVVLILVFFTIHMLFGRGAKQTSNTLVELRERLSATQLSAIDITTTIWFVFRCAAAWPVVIYLLIKGDKPKNG